MFHYVKSVHRRSFFLVRISLYLYNFHAVFQTCQPIFHQKCLHHYFMFSYLKNNVKFNVKLHWSKENIKWWKNNLEQCIFPIEQQGGIFIKGFNPSLPESFTAKKKSFPLKLSSVNVTKSKSAVSFTEEILNGNFHFLCSVSFGSLQSHFSFHELKHQSCQKNVIDCSELLGLKQNCPWRVYTLMSEKWNMYMLLKSCNQIADTFTLLYHIAQTTLKFQKISRS